MKKLIKPQEYDQHDDDMPIGRVLSRREMLSLLAGVAGSTLLVGCGAATVSSALSSSSATQAATVTSGTSAALTSSTMSASATTAATSAVATGSSGTLPSCVVVPALTEGPYFVDEKLNRSDVRSDPSTGVVKEGVILKLAFNVSQVGTNNSCAPYEGAFVDIWHCDAAGLYSDENQNNTVGQKFLRGYQVTDANGKAEFITIFPGWYQGRTVHIHFKIRSALDNNQSTTFTSQLFFDDAVASEIFRQSPYSSKGQSPMKNASDNIYRQGGSSLLLNLTKDGSGYATTFNIGVKKA